jgi:hypothetical protein
MGLPIVVEKEEETPAHCVYAFGPPGAPAGRARLLRASGDVEVLERPPPAEGTSASFYLAHLVARLQSYHEAGSYPDRDRWDA